MKTSNTILMGHEGVLFGTCYLASLTFIKNVNGLTESRAFLATARVSKFQETV